MSGGGGRLDRSFYARDTVAVARDLLGRVLVRQVGEMRLSAAIVEAEAYTGGDDPASHAFRGRTGRNASMFGDPGHAYVYRSYGIHFCLNLVTEGAGRPGATLIRAVHPLQGWEEMRRRRGRPDAELTDGPGKLCQALSIDLQLDGADLCCGRELWLEGGTPVPDERVAAAARVGLGGPEEARRRPWRYLVIDDPYVSRRPPRRRS